MGVDSPDDKRVFGRVNTDKKVMCKVLEVGTGDKFEDTELVVKNMSPGGVSFESNRALPQETIIKLELKLPLSTPQDEPSLVSGKVIRCVEDENTDKYEIGIAYIKDRK